MDSMAESWKTGGLDAGAIAALTERLSPSELWSLLMQVMTARARRDPARILDQWRHDGFTRPAAVDQRLIVELDRRLLAAVPRFEAIELSPLAPLGSCSAVALTSQQRVVSALRGCEVVSDPTNVLALECARRLREDPRRTVRLATVHRCVRAQPFPRRPGFAAHFRIFCLATAGLKGANHDAMVDALVDHIQSHRQALQAMRDAGMTCADLSVTVYGTPARAALADRIAAAIGPEVARDELRHAYYDGGLRFTIAARTASGEEVPLADGGAFEWLYRLTSNRKLSFVASGLGTQLLATRFAAGAESADKA
jgi:hypothetical protein